MHRFAMLLAGGLVLGGCALPPSSSSASPARADDEAPAWAAPDLARAVSVRNGRTGEPMSLEALLDELARVDAVFLGETHTDETTHRVELAVYEGLLERRGGDVVLAMEMFERDVQEHLDAYVAGEVDEPTFLQHARPWGNYHTAYRPMIERARADRLPVVASNFPRPLRVRIAMEGPEALEGLEESERDWVPAELHPNTPAYWKRVDNAVRSHRGMMGGTSDGDDSRLYSTQTLWDNSMGEACALALERHPGSSVLHVNGSFHSAYWEGTVRQFGLRAPDATSKTVAIITSAHPQVADLAGIPVADYVVFAESRATDYNDGSWTVEVPQTVRYRFHLPENADEASPVPLLIWLSDDGFGAEEGLQLWRDRLGDEAAIAVLEAPYRETQPDLSAGARWFWPDTFPADVGMSQQAVERAWAYLLRHYPLDPQRVCLAGEGTGATVVTASALFTGRMDVSAIAFDPRHYRKVKDFPLPLPEYRGNDRLPRKSLRIFTRASEGDWWSSELAEYQEVGFDSALVSRTEDLWRREGEAEDALREALGLEARAQPADAERRHLVLADATPRARLWARLVGISLAREEGCEVAVLVEPPAAARGSELVATELDPASFAEGDALPRCPGPFGGTTVLVLPDGIDEQTAAAWRGIEENDPLNAASRFHRVRVTDAASLNATLARLRDENRKNVFIIPAEFCASSDVMRSLHRSVTDLEDQMTLQWSPGLGVRLARAAGG